VPARRARRINGRSQSSFSRFENYKFGRTSKISDKQHANYGQTATDNYFSGGLWTVGFRVLLPETVHTGTRLRVQIVKSSIERNSFFRPQFPKSFVSKYSVCV
jgi:hypothetical protein